MSQDELSPTLQHDDRRTAPLADVKEAYRMWIENRGTSGEAFLALCDDAFDMRSVLSPDLPDALAAHRLSKAETADYFAIVARDWEMIDFRTDRFIADGVDVVMVGRCHWRHRRTGREVDTPKVDVWRFRDGKAVEFLEMFDSLAFAQAVEGDAGPA